MMPGAFDLESFAVICGLLAVLGWLVYSAARLLAIWDGAKRHVATLKAEQAQNAKTLLRNVKEMERLNDEIREARAGIETAVQAAGAKREALAKFVPPRPTEIYVTSEFPYAKKSRAWVAELKAANPARGRRAGKDLSHLLLVWAPDYMSAFASAPRFCPRKDYEVDKVRLLDP